MAVAAQDVKVRQPWLKYDSIVIGPGAKTQDTGWFNTWQEFASASKISWFGDRSSSVPDWATSDDSDRTDWPYMIHQFGIEFWAPHTLQTRNALLTDNWAPLYFTQNLPFRLAFRLQLAQTDQILKLPGVHAPGGTGASGTVLDNSPSAMVIPPSNGTQSIKNSWIFPDPVKISTRSLIRLETKVEFPDQQFLAQAVGPGSQFFPVNAAGDPALLGNYYIIRAWLRGARYIENIGARG